MDKLLARKYAIKAKGEDADRRDSLTSAYTVEIHDVGIKFPGSQFFRLRS
jgi:hypothetical protein